MNVQKSIVNLRSRRQTRKHWDSRDLRILLAANTHEIFPFPRFFAVLSSFFFLQRKTNRRQKPNGWPLCRATTTNQQEITAKTKSQKGCKQPGGTSEQRNSPISRNDIKMPGYGTAGCATPRRGAVQGRRRRRSVVATLSLLPTHAPPVPCGRRMPVSVGSPAGTATARSLRSGVCMTPCSDATVGA